MAQRKMKAILALLVAMSLVLTACGAGNTTATGTPAGAGSVATQAPAATTAPSATMAAATEAATMAATTAATMAATTAPVGSDMYGEMAGPAGGFLERAMAGEFTGTTVTVDGTQTDPDDAKMKQGWAAFEEATGITVSYVGNKEFEARISISIDAGQAPDIADFPQPGLVRRFVEQGKIVDVSTFLPEEYLTTVYDQSWLDMARMNGPADMITAGVWNRYSVKSLVWYPKDDFDAAGYEIPETWDELIALSDMIKADGDTPWCLGIESQAATGWPATDWLEDVMLRTTSPENYDSWVNGDLKFDSPEVRTAMERIGEIWTTEGYVYGGQSAIISTYFGDAPAPMFEDPPKCWMHRQANFITSFFPETAEAGVDYDFFYLPPIDDAYGKPFLVAGDMYVMFNDRPEVRALMEYFTLPMSVSGFLENGGGLAAMKTSSPEMYAIPQDAALAELVATTATAFRFDGSDLMPGAVGAGSFWKGMTDWASGSADLDTVLPEIDASWPR